MFTQRMKTAQLLFDSLPKMIGQTNWMKIMMMNINTSMMTMKWSMMKTIKMMIGGCDDDTDVAFFNDNLMAVSSPKNFMSSDGSDNQSDDEDGEDGDDGADDEDGIDDIFVVFPLPKNVIHPIMTKVTI